MIIQTHLVNGLYFEVFISGRSIEKVLLEGREIERIGSPATRLQFRFKHDGKKYRMKFDCGSDEHSYSSRTRSESTYYYQSTFEAKLWERVAEEDRKFFLPLFGASPAPEDASNFRGFVIQEEVQLEEKRLDADSAVALSRITEKYGLRDVSMGGTHNAAFVNGQPVIYDWGMEAMQY